MLTRCLCIDEAVTEKPKGPVRDDRPGRPATDDPWRPGPTGEGK